MKNWNELEKSSFFDANARERAVGLCDKGTFTELLGPQDRFESPHLPVLGTAVEFDDGTVTGVGLIGKHPVFVVSMEGKFIGGAIGAVFSGLMGVTYYLAGGAANFLVFTNYLQGGQMNTVWAIVGMAISFVIAAAVVYVAGFSKEELAEMEA